MTTTEKLYSLDEFMALPDDGQQYELWEGHIVAMSPANADQPLIGAALIEFLRAYVRLHHLGHVFQDNGIFTIDPIKRDYLSPDVAFVARGRLTSRPTKNIPVPPDLAVEILSDENYEHPDNFRKKLRKYQAAGVALIWVIDPRKMRVLVYHPNQDAPVATLGIDDILSGEEVISGFRLPVRALFEDDEFGVG